MNYTDLSKDGFCPDGNRCFGFCKSDGYCPGNGRNESAITSDNLLELAIELWNEREIKQRTPLPWNDAHPMARFIVICRVLRLMGDT